MLVIGGQFVELCPKLGELVRLGPELDCVRWRHSIGFWEDYIKADRGGASVFELSVEPGPFELTEVNNRTVVVVNGVRVFGKLEGQNPGGSVKDRAAYGMIKGALNRGELKPGIRLVEATSGNTGIALAMAAAERPARLDTPVAWLLYLQSQLYYLEGSLEYFAIGAI